MAIDWKTITLERHNDHIVEEESGYQCCMRSLPNDPIKSYKLKRQPDLPATFVFYTLYDFCSKIHGS